MKCDSCGLETPINYGNAYTVLCSKCNRSDKGRALISDYSRQAEMHKMDGAMDGPDYKTSILIATIVSGMGWVMCSLAFIIVLIAFAGVGKFGLLALAPGLGIFIGGLILVIAGQSFRALLDNANYTKQILEEIRKKA